MIYEIDGRAVDKKRFEAFLASLKEIPGTWFCAEAMDGGRTGYDTEDSSGVRYKYMTTVKGAINKTSITRIER